MPSWRHAPLIPAPGTMRAITEPAARHAIAACMSEHGPPIPPEEGPAAVGRSSAKVAPPPESQYHADMAAASDDAASVIRAIDAARLDERQQHATSVRQRELYAASYDATQAAEDRDDGWRVSVPAAPVAEDLVRDLFFLGQDPEAAYAIARATHQRRIMSHATHLATALAIATESEARTAERPARSQRRRERRGGT